MIRIVCCYVNEDKVMAEKLFTQLQLIVRSESINLYNTQMVLAGQIMQEEIENHINEAHIILLLISSDFLSSPPLQSGLEQARKRHQDYGARVVPIFLWPSHLGDDDDWIRKLRTLPIDPLPTDGWSEGDYFIVADGIKKVVQELQVRQMVEEAKKQCERGDLNASLKTYGMALTFYRTSQVPGGDLSLLSEIHEGSKRVQELQVWQMVEEAKKQCERGDFKAALETYDRALTLYHDNALQIPCEDPSLLSEIHMGKMDAFFADGQWDNAWESYKPTPNNSSTSLKQEEKLRLLGQQYEERPRWDWALVAYEQAIHKDESNARLHFAKGRVLLSKDNLSGALDAYKKAAKLEPRFAAQPIPSKEMADEKLPGKCVVQIIFNGNINGTGFFVAPGIILTAIPAPLSHFDEVINDTIKIKWGTDYLDARIGKKFPQLALLYLNKVPEEKYPYLPLSGDILSFDALRAYGYSLSHPSGFSRSLTAVGFEEDIQRIGLKPDSGDCVDDMSGAPLVNLRTGSVCGIMTQKHKETLLDENAISMQTVIDSFKELVHLHTHMQEVETFQQVPGNAIDIFIIYASADADLSIQLLQAIQKANLQNLRLSWNTNRPVPKQQSAHLLQCLEKTQFFLFLISPDFLASEELEKYCISKALEQHKRNKCEIIPILLRSDETWRKTDYGTLQELPKIGDSIDKQTDKNVAFESVARGIEEALQADPSLYLEPRYTKKCRIFYSYADEDAGDFLRSEPVLKMKGQILGWHRTQIIAGHDRGYEIRRHLEAAQIVLIFESHQYENSSICQVERDYANAIQRRRKKDLKIISRNTTALVALQPSIDEWKKRLDKAFKQFNAPTPRQRAQKVLFFALALLLACSLVAGGARIQASLPPSAMVTVNFVPLIQQINQQAPYTFLASPDIKDVEFTTKTIPAYYSNDSGIEISQGDTTGEVNCFAVLCKQGVSENDVNNLSKQMMSQLQVSISQQLQGQIADMHGMQINPMDSFRWNQIADPRVGQESRTVNVTVLGVGTAEYVLSADITNLVHQLLVAQIPPGYQIIERTFYTTGPLVINGDGSLGMKAVATACYQFSQDQLNRIHTGLAGQSIAAAESFLRGQSGVSHKGIQIHFTSGGGKDLPTDSQHIKLSFQCPTNPPANSQIF